MKVQKFTATLNKEGSTGSIRGKIPASLVNALGGQDGDVMEFETNGRTIVGGRIITGKEAKALRSAGRTTFASAVQAPAKAKSPKVKQAVKKAAGNGKGRSVVSLPVPKAKAKAPVKAKAAPAKSNKRKTSVKITPPASKAKKPQSRPRFSL